MSAEWKWAEIDAKEKPGIPALWFSLVNLSTEQNLTPDTSPFSKPDKGKSVRLIRLLAFIVVPALFVGFIAFAFAKTSPPRDLINKPGPSFTLPLLGGGSLSSEQIKGVPVVINFWASWCIPCRKEAGVLEEKWQAYKAQGVKFVGVNVQDSAEDAQQFVDEHKLTFPMVRDVDLVLYRKFGVRGMPETFFLDHTYRFAAIESGTQLGQRGGTKVLGAIEPGLLEAQIQHLLDRTQLDRTQGASNTGHGGSDGEKPTG